MRTLDQLARFDAARVDARNQDVPLPSVFTHLLAVPARLAARVPYRLQVEHRRAMTALAGAA